jgi:copper chaperone CopZ
MPDVTLRVQNFSDASEAARLERALSRLGFVNEVKADAGRGLVAISYEGGKEELTQIGHAVEESGHKFESTAGAKEAGS